MSSNKLRRQIAVKLEAAGKRITPGTWRWTSDGKPVDLETFESPGYFDNVELTSDNGDQIIACGEYDVLVGYNGEGPSTRVANGHLLAAAPKLLAALCAVADRINAASGSPSFTSDEHDELLNIIYAARGEASK